MRALGFNSLLNIFFAEDPSPLKENVLALRSAHPSTQVDTASLSANQRCFCRPLAVTRSTIGQWENRTTVSSLGGLFCFIDWHTECKDYQNEAKISVWGWKKKKKDRWMCDSSSQVKKKNAVAVCVQCALSAAVTVCWHDERHGVSIFKLNCIANVFVYSTINIRFLQIWSAHRVARGLL